MTKSRRRMNAAFLALSMVVLVSACGQTQGPRSSVATSTEDRGIAGNKDRPMSWDASISREFRNLKAAERAAKLIVKGVAGSSTVETVSGVPFTVTQLTTSRSLKGGDLETEIRVRQFGDAYNTEGALAPILESGQSYLLFLEPFEFEPGVATGQWVIVGGVAAWSEDHNGELRRMAKESELPVILTATHLEELS